ncbi:hypothetical protein BDN70DRAFT_531296 [Pholiota conissans]|uniref:F-box domain-containing protein n=1 Tax=Pholiota conissans TaxID=109636 RepID=A0A9P5YPW6_9AGAR|nr:hypothetical protein BDN70DRAFT_531296 [Pholiota conissans]
METSLVERKVDPLKNDLEASLRYNPSDIAHLLPFPQESSDDLHHELWSGGGRTWDMRSDELPALRRQVKDIKAYILWNLRIHAKSITPRVLRTLDGFWDRFPTELICSIYSLLHPIDLYHTLCSTKRLRHFLLDKKSSFIWRASFLNYPDIPFYPDDVSAPKWASLIFGPPTCDGCEMSNFLGEYALHRRNCGIRDVGCLSVC